MKSGRSFTGVHGLIPQDAAMTASMGMVFDRAREHLVPADAAVLRMRRMLLRATKTVATGGDPVGLDGKISFDKIQGGSGTIQAGDSWKDMVPGNVAL